MENGNGTTQQVSPTVGTGIFPWSPIVGIDAPSEQPPAERPTVNKYDRSWMRTPEGRAKLSAAIKAGWAKKKLAAARRAVRIAAAEREEQARPNVTTIDRAIAYHQDAIRTLQAAKALLK